MLSIPIYLFICIFSDGFMIFSLFTMVIIYLILTLITKYFLNKSKICYFKLISFWHPLLLLEYISIHFFNFNLHFPLNGDSRCASIPFQIRDDDSQERGAGADGMPGFGWQTHDILMEKERHNFGSFAGNKVFNTVFFYFRSILNFR